MRLLAVATSLCLACSHTPAARVPVTVVVRGDAIEVARAQAALAKAPPEGVEIRPLSLTTPLAPPESPAGIEGALDKVRVAYDEPSWQRCMSPISEPSLVPSLLAAEKRDAAARVLFWRSACLLLKGDEAGAKSAARTFAGLDLEIPLEKWDSAVPRLLHEAMLEASRESASTVNVVSAGPELTVSLDGRRAVCVAGARFPRGMEHTRSAVDADGKSPEVRDVSVEQAPVVVHFNPPPASPNLAARQWVSRWSSSPRSTRRLPFICSPTRRARATWSCWSCRAARMRTCEAR